MSDPSQFCNDCISLCNDLKSELQDKTVQEQVVTLAEQICAQVGQYQALCKSFVEAQLPTLLNELAGEIDGKQICTSLKLCSATQVSDYKPNFLKDMMIKAFLKRAL